MKVVVELIGTISDGGAESLVRDYAIHVRNEEFDVKIITMYPPSETSANYRILKQRGIDVVSVFTSGKTSILYRILNKLTFNYYIYYKLYRIIKSIAPTAIHIHLDILRFIKPFATKLHGIKLLYTCHNCPCRLFNSTNKKGELMAAQYLLHNNGLQMIALHNGMRKELNDMFSIDNTIVVRNGIDVERFSNTTEDKEAIRNSIGIPVGSFVVGHIGRFTGAKNHLFLIEIFKELLMKRENAFLLMVGSGPLKKEIEQKIIESHLQNRCLILEHRTDIPQLLKAMDIFVFPSIFEGLPVTLVEAQAAHKRCIVSDLITAECFLSTNTIPLSIDNSAQYWAEAILDTNRKGAYEGDIYQFDMENVSEHLRSIYRS